MNELAQYISATLGEEVHPKVLPKEQLGGVPLYIAEGYQLYAVQLLDRSLILAKPKEKTELSVLQTQKHFTLIRHELNKPVVLILGEITAFNRKRLIEKGINFIIPGKQLFLPELLLDLNENFANPRTPVKRPKLLPSSQSLVIYHLLHRDGNLNIEGHPFKVIAQRLGYTATAITKVIGNLKHLNLILVKGEKEKSIEFLNQGKELWQDLEARQLFIDPVIKRIFTDIKLPMVMLHSYNTALAEYTEINTSRQECFAIDKHEYYKLNIQDQPEVSNLYDAKFCIEIWKYNPQILVNNVELPKMTIDPLSLYLTMRNNNDPRVEMALNQILNEYLW